MCPPPPTQNQTPRVHFCSRLLPPVSLLHVVRVSSHSAPSSIWALTSGASLRKLVMPVSNKQDGICHTWCINVKCRQQTLNTQSKYRK